MQDKSTENNQHDVKPDSEHIKPRITNFRFSIPAPGDYEIEIDSSKIIPELISIWRVR